MGHGMRVSAIMQLAAKRRRGIYRYWFWFRCVIAMCVRLPSWSFMSLSGPVNSNAAMSRQIKCTNMRRPCMRYRRSGSPSHCKKKHFTGWTEMVKKSFYFKMRKNCATIGYKILTCKNVLCSSRNNLNGIVASDGFRNSFQPFLDKYWAPFTSQTASFMPEMKQHIKWYELSCFTLHCTNTISELSVVMIIIIVIIVVTT